MKKLILTLSSSVVALSPVVAVIACGKNETDADKKAINELLARVVNPSVEEDLSSVVSEATYTGEAKTAVETKIKTLIKGTSNLDWIDNTFNGIAFTFTYVSTSTSDNQAITIKIEGTKNNKTVSSNVVIKGTPDNSPDAQITNVKIALDTLLGTATLKSTKDTNDLDDVSADEITLVNFHTQFAVTKNISTIDKKDTTISFEITPIDGKTGKKYNIEIEISMEGGTAQNSSIIVQANDFTETDSQKVESVKTEIENLISNIDVVSKTKTELETIGGFGAFTNEIASKAGIPITLPIGVALKGVELTYMFFAQQNINHGDNFKFDLTIILKIDNVSQNISKVIVSSTVHNNADDIAKAKAEYGKRITGDLTSTKEWAALSQAAIGNQTNFDLHEILKSQLGITPSFPGEAYLYGTTVTGTIQINSDDQKVVVTLTISKSLATSDTFIFNVLPKQ